MKFFYYLYAKGESVFTRQIGGRGLIITPVWFLTTFFSMPLLPGGMEEYPFMVMALCWLGILIGITYLIIPRRKAKTESAAWISKYSGASSLWAWLYIISGPILMLLLLDFLPLD